MAKIGRIRTKTGAKYGQHFLFDQSILHRIIEASRLEQEDNVLEIGAGLGPLSILLAEQVKRVVSVEIDPLLMPRLTKNTADYGNIDLVNDDIMKLDLETLLREKFGSTQYKVVANLPYYITTPIMMMLLEGPVPPQSITVMVQKEVAERFAAEAGDREYGAISAVIRYYAQVEKVMTVPASAFTPSPKVDSALLHLEMRTTPPVTVKSIEMLFKTIKAGFAMRRKTLRNNLMQAFGWKTVEVDEIAEKAGIDPGIRAETLSLEQFARLSDALYDQSQKETKGKI